VGREAPPLRRVGKVARAFAGLPKVMAATPSHCEVGTRLAERVGLGPGVARGLGQMFERWDGGGQPNGLKHEAVDRAVTVAHVAADALTMFRLAGADAALAMVRQRSGKGYSPVIAEAFVHAPAAVLGPRDVPSLREAVLQAEPEPARRLDAEGAERAIRAVGEYADMKSG
jgi:hypothetical protein